jgi:hypothetical protein
VTIGRALEACAEESVAALVNVVEQPEVAYGGIGKERRMVCGGK